MPPKTKFEGEGNPTEDLGPTGSQIPNEVQLVSITPLERRVLKDLLDRDRTSRIVHGGLKSLLTFNDDEIGVLLGFLDRI